MEEDRIEKRLRRLDAALARSEQRLGTLVDVHDHHERRVTVALANAEAARDAFVLSARVAFRDPYRALKSWERHEWRLANLTLGEPTDAEVVRQAHAAVTGSTGIAGLTLRGRTRLGQDDPERAAARAALAKMGDERAAWREGVRLARTYGQALNQVGEQIRALRDRVRSAGFRREELVEELREVHRRSRDRERQPRPDAVGERALRADDERIAERAELHRAYGEIVEGKRVAERSVFEQSGDEAAAGTAEERAKRERARLERLRTREQSRDLSR